MRGPNHSLDACCQTLGCWAAWGFTSLLGLEALGESESEIEGSHLGPLSLESPPSRPPSTDRSSAEQSLSDASPVRWTAAMVVSCRMAGLEFSASAGAAASTIDVTRGRPICKCRCEDHQMNKGITKSALLVFVVGPPSRLQNIVARVGNASFDSRPPTHPPPSPQLQWRISPMAVAAQSTP